MTVPADPQTPCPECGGSGTWPGGRPWHRVDCTRPVSADPSPEPGELEQQVARTIRASAYFGAATGLIATEVTALVREHVAKEIEAAAKRCATSGGIYYSLAADIARGAR